MLFYKLWVSVRLGPFGVAILACSTSLALLLWKCSGEVRATSVMGCNKARQQCHVVFSFFGGWGLL